MLTSGIYSGNVRHRRFTPKSHRFDYGLYMLALDLDEMHTRSFRVLGTKWHKPLRISATDHFSESVIDELRGQDDTEYSVLKKAAIKQANALLTEQSQAFEISKTQVVMVSQARCFGVYFSPINFYFLSVSGQDCQFMLAEVSNTPWNQTHYYLIDLFENKRNEGIRNEKAFHVSPFLPMNMRYQWTVRAPAEDMFVHIENWLEPNSGDEIEHKVFDATMTLKHKSLNQRELRKLLIKMPIMTIKIMAGIYWQATKLFLKRIPFIGHPQSS